MEDAEMTYYGKIDGLKVPYGLPKMSYIKERLRLATAGYTQ